MENASGHIGESFCIIDNGGLSPESAQLRERGFASRNAPLALQRVQERRFLSADIPPGTGVNAHIEIEPGTENRGAEISFPVSFSDSPADPVGRTPVSPAQKDIARIGLYGISGQNQSFQELVRISLHQDAILESARFHFVGV